MLAYITNTLDIRFILPNTWSDMNQEIICSTADPLRLSLQRKNLPMPRTN